MREYVISRRAERITDDCDGENYLARTVHETEELIDVGILDHAGNKVMARKKMDPIGFLRWKDT